MNDLDTRKLRMLCELDARGTIAQVASSLHMTPSAVSQQLAVLGREVGVQLIEPDGRRVRLTAAAHLLVAHGLKILEQVERACASLAVYTEGSGGAVRISGHSGTLASIGPSVVVQLLDTHPELVVSLYETEPAESTAMLLRDEVDIVIGVANRFESVIDDARFTAVPLVMDDYELVLPPHHRLAYAPSVRIADLASDTWVLASVGLCREIGLAACRAAGFTPPVTHVMGDWAGVLAAVRLGLGVALMPRLVAPEREPGLLFRVPSGEPLRYQLIAMVRRGTEVAPNIASVLNALDNIVKDRLALQAA